MYRAVQMMVIYVWTMKLTHVVKENMVFDSAGVNAYKEAKEEEALQPMLVAQMKQAELQRPMWEAMMSTMIPALSRGRAGSWSVKMCVVLWDGGGCLSR